MDVKPAKIRRLADLVICQLYVDYDRLLDTIVSLQSKKKNPVAVKIRENAIVDGYHRFWAYVCLGYVSIQCVEESTADLPGSPQKNIVIYYLKEESEIDPKHLKKIETFCKERNMTVSCKRDETKLR